MAAYLLAQLTFTNRAAYKIYLRDFTKVLEAHAGRVLIADEQPCVLEGSWSGDKVVLLEFADEVSCRAFLTAPDYVRIAAYRKAGASASVLLLQGFDQPAAPATQSA